MSRSPRAWWRSASAMALIVLAAAGPALGSPGHLAAGVGLTTSESTPEASFVVGRARFEPLDGARPLGSPGVGDYRGALEVVPDGGSVALVNDVGVEDYVSGISEVPSEWPSAALEAQAVAARTYLLHSAIAPSPTLRALGAQICANQDCQVYSGLAKERGPDGRRWVDAVAATAGQVLLYGGRPINAMYSSSNGGRTVDGGEPYLRAIDDPDDAASPLSRWEADVTLGELARALHLPGVVTSITRAGDTLTITSAVPPPATATGSTTTSEAPNVPDSPRAGAVQPASQALAASPAPILPAPSTSTTSTTSTTSAPNPSPANPPGSNQVGGGASTTTTAPAGSPSAAPGRAGGDRGTLTISTADFTLRVNGALPPVPGRDVFLPSDRFEVKLSSTSATFRGGGFGHGIGMSQYGALGKANRGLSASDILAFYYGGLRPTRLSPAAIPPTVRVDVADGLPGVDVTGRFRLVDEHDNVLITVGDGPWRVVPAPGGRVRVILPDPYHGPFGVAGVAVDPPVVVPGAKLTVRFSLPVPGLASVSATPPGGAPVTTDLGITVPGTHQVQVPPASNTGIYRLRIAAEAGAGRQSDSVLEINVGTAPAAVPDLTRFSPGPRARAAAVTRPPASGGFTVAIIMAIALALGAIVATALVHPRGPRPGRSRRAT